MAESVDLQGFADIVAARVGELRERQAALEAQVAHAQLVLGLFARALAELDTHLAAKVADTITANHLVPPDDPFLNLLVDALHQRLASTPRSSASAAPAALLRLAWDAEAPDQSEP